MEHQQLYPMLLVSLIVGSLIAIGGVFWSLTVLHGEQDPFKELFFIDPDALASHARLGEPITFSVAMTGFHIDSGLVPYEYGVELFRLYPAIESRYRCLQSLRPRRSLMWEVGDFSAPVLRVHQHISPLIVKGNQNDLIPWERYTFTTYFPRPTGHGLIGYIYKNADGEQLYGVYLDEQRSVIWFNDEPFPVEGSLYEDGNNELRIRYSSGRVQVWVGSRLLLEQPFDDHQPGWFTLVSQDTYVLIEHVAVYRDSLIMIPDDGSVWHYVVAVREPRSRRERLMDIQQLSIQMQQEFLSFDIESIDCSVEPFYCEYFDLPNDIFFFLTHDNLSLAIDRIPVATAQNRRFFDIENKTIEWDQYEISFEHPRIPMGSRGMMVIEMSDSWAIGITRNNTYYFHSEGGRIRINEYRNPEKPDGGVDLVRIRVIDEQIHMTINGVPVFRNTITSVSETGMIVFHMKDMLLPIRDLRVDNLECSIQNVGDRLCQIRLIIFPGVTSQPPTPPVQVALSDQQIVIDDDMEYDELLISHVDTFDVDPWVSGIPFEIDNTLLPSSSLVLDNPLLRFSSQHTEKRLQFHFEFLDGAHLLKAGIRDSSGNQRFGFIISGLHDALVMQYQRFDQSPMVWLDMPHPSIRSMRQRLIWGEQFVADQHIYVPALQGSLNWTNFASQRHRLDIHVVDRVLTVRLNNQVIGQSIVLPSFDGHFFIEMPHSYVDMENVRVQIPEAGINRLVRYRDNPCQFYLVHRESHQGEVLLADHKRVVITPTISIHEPFHYAKLFTRLVDEDLSVHFWVMSDD